MPLINGFYMQGYDYPYETVATYQLKTYITFALVGLHKIENEDTSDLELFDNTVQYYRFYLDKVFYCLGQIHSRFNKISKGNPAILKVKNEYVDLNRLNYNFSEDVFPILSNKMPRNIIEHVDERNLLTIKEFNGVGGFNVIFADSDSELTNTLMSNRRHYPYTLDMRNKTVYFYNIQNEDDNTKTFEINLEKLKKELMKLNDNVKTFDSYLTY